jgi:hypothetical protein
VDEGVEEEYGTSGGWVGRRGREKVGRKNDGDKMGEGQSVMWCKREEKGISRCLRQRGE